MEITCYERVVLYGIQQMIVLSVFLSDVGIDRSWIFSVGIHYLYDCNDVNL